MNIQVKATNLELTESIRQYVESKISSLERLVGQWDQEGSVAVKVEVAKTTKHHRHGDVFYAEAMLVLPGKTIRAQSTEPELHAAIDRVRDKLQREIKKYKETR